MRKMNLSVVLLLTAAMVTAKRDKDRIASERLIQADEAAAEPKDGDKVIAQAANAKSGLTKMMQKEDRASLETDDGMRTQMDTMKADISTLKATHEEMKTEQGSLKAHVMHLVNVEDELKKDQKHLQADTSPLKTKVAALESNNGQRWSEKRE